MIAALSVGLAGNCGCGWKPDPAREQRSLCADGTAAAAHRLGLGAAGRSAHGSIREPLRSRIWTGPLKSMGAEFVSCLADRECCCPCRTTWCGLRWCGLRSWQGTSLDAAEADEVARAVSEAAAGNAVAAVQVDFDARQSQREWYAGVLRRSVRAEMPAQMPLSMTALASWCSYDGAWLRSLPVDEAVPMLFRMEPGPAEGGRGGLGALVTSRCASRCARGRWEFRRRRRGPARWTGGVCTSSPTAAGRGWIAGDGEESAMKSRGRLAAVAVLAAGVPAAMWLAGVLACGPDFEPEVFVPEHQPEAPKLYAAGQTRRGAGTGTSTRSWWWRTATLWAER